MSNNKKHLHPAGIWLNEHFPRFSKYGPNTLTCARAPLAAAGFIFLMFGVAGNPVNIGAWLFFLSYLTDLEGYLARLTGNLSVWGAKWENYADAVAVILSFIYMLTRPDVLHLIKVCMVLHIVRYGYLYLLRWLVEKVGKVPKATDLGRTSTFIIMASIPFYLLPHMVTIFSTLFLIGFGLSIIATVQYTLKAKAALR